MPDERDQRPDRIRTAFRRVRKLAAERAAAVRLRTAAMRARVSGWVAAHPAARRRAAAAFHVAALLGIGLAALAYGCHVYRAFGRATVDDAAITYAFADNLASGNGFRLTPGEAPVEGFSNPLEVFLLVPFAYVMDDLDPAAKAINIGLTALALALLAVFVYVHLRSAGRLLAIVPLGLATYWCGFNYWIAAGLEGGLLTGLQIGSLIALFLASDRRWADVTLGVLAGLLVWCRPEGILYGAVVVGVRIFLKSDGRRWLAPGIFAASAAALLCMRWAAFRDVVPNTYWAKVPGRGLWWSLSEKTSPGRTYVDGFFRERWWYFAFPLYVAAPAWREAGAVAAAAALQLGVAVFFPICVGGDWMAEWRFMQPMMGPLAVLSALGIVGLVGCERRALASLKRLATVALVVIPGVVAASTSPGWRARERQIAGRRDIDVTWARRRVPGFHKLLEPVRLARRPLIGEVDIGGTAYRSGLDILDIAGLSDRALALARARRPAIASDYVYGERMPDVIYLHSSWLTNTPLQKLSPFETAYREVDGAYLASIGLTPMTAVRAELVDPPSAPALRTTAELPGARIVGTTAVPVRDGFALVLHARRHGTAPLGNPAWVSRDGRRFQARWHAGIPMAAGPPGSALVAIAHLPASTRLPVELAGADLRFDRWPRAEVGDSSAEALSRLPVARLAGGSFAGCDPDRLLDPAAGAVERARGAGFVARVCRGLAPDLAETWRARAMDATENAADPDERYDAAAATLTMGVPQWLSTRLLLEDARSDHAHFDEVLDAWAREDLADPVTAPDRAAAGLRMLLAARRYGDVVLEGLLLGPELAWVRGPLCTAARRLGMRPDRVATGLDCAAVPDVEPARVVRQSFESPDAADLAYLGDATALRPTATRRLRTDQHEIGGGHGRLFVNSYDDKTLDGAVGEVVWGPLPWAGRRFGALVGGGARGKEIRIVVEGRAGDRWEVLAEVSPAQSDEVMRPRIADLGPREVSQVRVRVVDAGTAPWGHILADALTFIDEPTGGAVAAYETARYAAPARDPAPGSPAVPAPPISPAATRGGAVPSPGVQ